MATVAATTTTMMITTTIPKTAPGCVNVGPACAAPSFGEAAEAFLAASRELGYSAEGARMEEVAEWFKELEACS